MRIFLLGDSFTDNTYKSWIQNIRENQEVRMDSVGKYVTKVLENQLPDPLHFEDYLKMWGHEVINLGSNGCTNDTIFYSFSRIDSEFREGDRIIINWTGLNRYNWIGKADNVISINGGKPDDYETNPKTKILFDQYILRMESSKPGGSLMKNLGPFMKYLLDVNARYKPIMWIPSDFPNEFFRDQKFYMYEPSNEAFRKIIPEFDKLTIEGETDIKDRHYGRWGNFYLAVIFNAVLKYTEEIDHDGYYIRDQELYSKVIEEIKNSQSNIPTLPESIFQKFKGLI